MTRNHITSSILILSKTFKQSYNNKKIFKFCTRKRKESFPESPQTQSWSGELVWSKNWLLAIGLCNNLFLCIFCTLSTGGFSRKLRRMGELAARNCTANFPDQLYLSSFKSLPHHAVTELLYITYINFKKIGKMLCS
jgi:hypothetical protein